MVTAPTEETAIRVAMPGDPGRHPPGRGGYPSMTAGIASPFPAFVIARRAPIGAGFLGLTAVVLDGVVGRVIPLGALAIIRPGGISPRVVGGHFAGIIRNAPLAGIGMERGVTRVPARRAAVAAGLTGAVVAGARHVGVAGVAVPALL